MQVNRIVVPPQAVSAGRRAMTGRFTLDEVAQAVRAANEEVGLDAGDHSAEEFSELVARRLVERAMASGAVRIDEAAYLSCSRMEER